MGKNKPPKGVTSNISSAANPASSSVTQTTNQSSILQSSFSPSVLQLSLFASVIQGLDSQHLRIHDTTTGRLRCEHAIASRASITCLDWGYYGENNPDRHRQESKKKRKRSELVNGDSSYSNVKDGVVAFGTTDSEVHIFSLAEAKVLKVLGGAHSRGVRDFRFKKYGLNAEAWSIGGDAKLLQWDLRKGRVVRTVALPFGSATTLCPLSSTVICASQNAYIFDPDSTEPPSTFTASTNTIHSIIDSASKSPQATRFLTAAKQDRYMNVFSAESPTLIGSLRTENEILSLDLFSRTDALDHTGRVEDVLQRRLRPQDLLLVVNKDGALEIFLEPFNFDNAASKDEAKGMKARMQKRSRPKDNLIRLRRPDKNSSIVPLLDASFQGNEIVVAWVEGGINLLFERIPWRDEGSGNMILKDVTDVIKSKGGAGIGAAVINGVKDMGRSHVDESRTVIANGGDADDVPMADGPTEVIEISSGEESESEDELPPRLAEDADVGAKEASTEEEDVVMKDTETQAAADPNLDVEQDHAGQADEPSFGDLIRANAPDAVDVQASFADPNAQSLVPAGDRSLQQLPQGMSLGTVLTQSLRTNDNNILETCLHVKDLSTVRATIERLDSSFATILLQRLAERLHSRPGRAGSLMVWIQWTLVAHGGYLAGQPEVMKKLASLHRVVKERANSLQSLLSLKGKLDMLEAQMNLRKSMQARSKAANALEEDDEGVIYVEGQDESDSEEEEGAASGASDPRLHKGKAQSPRLSADNDSEPDDGQAESEDEEDSGEEMPTTNGAVAESEDDDNDSDEEGLFDEEASSTDHDSVDEASEDELDHDSVDSSDTSDADASPPPKRPAKSKLSNGISARHR